MLVERRFFFFQNRLQPLTADTNRRQPFRNVLLLQGNDASLVPCGRNLFGRFVSHSREGIQVAGIRTFPVVPNTRNQHLNCWPGIEGKDEVCGIFARLKLAPLIQVFRNILIEAVDDHDAVITSVDLVPEAAQAKGLTDATTDRRGLWDRLIAAFISSDPETRSPELLGCFLFNLRSIEPELTEIVLEEVLHDPLLSEWFPSFQGRVEIFGKALARLKQSLTNGNAPAERYRGLGWPGKPEDPAVLELAPLLLRLADGFYVALNMVWIRIIQLRNERKGPTLELASAGRSVVEACEFDWRLNREAHELQEVIEACLVGPEGIATVEIVFDRLKVSHAKYGMGFMEESRILGALLAVQPVVVLNLLFVSAITGDEGGMRGFFDHHGVGGSPLNRVPASTLLTWCDQDATVRYPLIAARFCPFSKHQTTAVREWKEVALALLDRAPNKIEVLKQYVYQLRPISWSGSRSATWEANAKLLDVFESHPDAELAEFARNEREKLRTTLDELRQEELNSERRDNERFE